MQLKENMSWCGKKILKIFSRIFFKNYRNLCRPLVLIFIIFAMYQQQYLRRSPSYVWQIQSWYVGMLVCMYCMYICTRMYECIYVYTYVCMLFYMYVCMLVRMYVCIYEYIYLHACIQASRCMYVYMYVYTNVYMYLHACIQASCYMHAYAMMLVCMHLKEYMRACAHVCS